MEQVLRKMRELCDVSDSSVNELLGCVSRCHFPRRSVLVREGVRSGYAYFIERGITRSFWVVDGVEITTSFSTEGAVVFSMDEVYYEQPSEEYIEALEPVEAYAIAVDDLRRLWSQNLELANWGRIIHQNEYRRLHRSHKERLTLPAGERYAEFCRQFPEVCARVQLGYIASYLGITLPTLSEYVLHQGAEVICVWRYLMYDKFSFNPEA